MQRNAASGLFTKSSFLGQGIYGQIRKENDSVVRRTMDKKEKNAETDPEERPVKDSVELSGRDELTEKLKEAEKRAEENHERYVRAIADLDNYKKRSEKEKSDLRRFCNEEIMKDVAPFIDTLSRAINHACQVNDLEALRGGLKLVQEQLVSSLRKHGLEEIEAVGKTFDPHVHEAMLHLDSDQHACNEIIEEYERGYLLQGRLLKPARVSVCKGPGTKENNQ
ncbi:MAG: nucleotide exchange factor GrpE [Smithellaceae bacterium]|nr:nucleotide exchange factor GrpE [Smithellaceae bacterium]